MTKRVVRREDGRAVIYYDFEDENPARDAETQPKAPQGDAHE